MFLCPAMNSCEKQTLIAVHLFDISWLPIADSYLHTIEFPLQAILPVWHSIIILKVCGSQMEPPLLACSGLGTSFLILYSSARSRSPRRKTNLTACHRWCTWKPRARNTSGILSRNGSFSTQITVWTSVTVVSSTSIFWDIRILFFFCTGNFVFHFYNIHISLTVGLSLVQLVIFLRP